MCAEVHHLIYRYLEEYMDVGLFHQQRNYWANIIVLCKSCHKVLHKYPRNMEFNVKCIDKKKLEEIKEKYGIEDETEEKEM